MTHIPVLLREILQATTNLHVERFFDGTFGRAGHLQELMKKFPHAKAVAFDRDLEAIEFGQTNFVEDIKSGKLVLHHRDFRDFDVSKFGKFNFMLLDLGVSSPQLDIDTRGFSFYQDGPLDMRMNQEDTVSAADLLNSLSEDELNRIFQNYGEIRRPYRVARAIVHDRMTTPWSSTKALAAMIERVEGWRIKGHHPATQYFMALRLAVNSELEAVQLGVRKCIEGLTEGGLLAVITFHSLEDRIVKQIFRGEPTGYCVNKKVIVAADEELKSNPRSRSAKLRIFAKGPRLAE